MDTGQVLVRLVARQINRCVNFTNLVSRAYMVDGIYQSVVSFFIPYIFVILTVAASGNGLDIAERTRLGCYIAHPAVITINTYILIRHIQKVSSW